MDVALFGASASLAAYLPKCVFGETTSTESISMAVTIGLSLGIFSLCILEVAPISASSWFFLILSPDIIKVKEGNQEATTTTSGEIMVDKSPIAASVGYATLTISRAYWFLLWALTLVILVVLPSLMGTAMIDSFGSCFRSSTTRGDRDPDDKKYRLVKWRNFPWWCRFLNALVRIMITKFCMIIHGIMCLLTSQTNQSTVGGLIMTVNEDHEILRSSTSTDSLGEGRTNPENSTISNSSSPRTASKHNKWAASLGSICGVSFVIVIASSMGPLVVHTTTDKNALSVLVSWICAVGFMASSILNGFGSVSMPYTCLSGLYLKPVRPEAITNLESEQRSVLEALATKRKAVRELTVSVNPSSRQLGRTSSLFNMTGGSSNKIQFSDIGDDVTNRKQILSTEIGFLEDLYKEVGEDIKELRHTQTQAAAARTMMGRLRSYVGLVFSLILLVRLISAGWTIWRSYTIDTNLHRVAQGDIVTKVLLWLTGHHLVSQEDYVYLSQIVSLVMTFILSFSQVRTFLRAAAAVNRKFMRFSQKCNCTSPPDLREETNKFTNSNHSSEGVLTQMIAMLTGCYCLSCIVVLKMMLPEQLCVSFATALGGMDVFTIHTSFVNGAFACSAAISVAMLAALFGIQRQNNFRHTSLEKSGGFKGADAV